MLFLGTRKGLLRYDPSAGGWSLTRVSFRGVPVESVLVDPRTGHVFAGLDHGHWGCKLHRSVDGGETWTELKTPAYPEGEQFRNPFDGAVQPATLTNLWVLQAGGPDQPGVLYAGTNPGGLFRSTNNGDTWSLMRGLWDHPTRLGEEGGRPGWYGGGRDTPGVHSVLVDPRSSDRLFVGISCGGVFESTDGGDTWAPRNVGLPAPFLPDPDGEVGHDPHLVVQCARSPDALWQQNHMGVFRSVDAGRTWVDCSEEDGPVGFGFPIVVGDDPAIAWVIPADSDQRRSAKGDRLLVRQTTDGGRTWRDASQGLPEGPCFDLVYRHAFARRGHTLAFGSTTGNAFVRAGDAPWACLSNHLPPVYCVAFGAA